MKKFVFIFLFLMLLSLTSCQTQPKLTEAEQIQIQEDWRKDHQGNIGLYFYLGDQKGYKILLCDSGCTAIGRLDVDEYDFIYPCLFSICMYKDGGFEYLEEAYEKGLLNHNDIKDIYKDYASFMKRQYPEFYAYTLKNK